MATETRRPTSLSSQNAFPIIGGTEVAPYFGRGAQYYAAAPEDLIFGPQNGFAHGDTIQSLVGLPGVINSVTVGGVARCDASPLNDRYCSVFIGLKIDGGLYAIKSQIAYDYQGGVPFSQLLTTNPKTGVAWVPADIPGLGWYAGVNYVSFHGVAAYVDDWYVIIDYTALGAPAAPSNLTGSAAGFNVTLNWQDNSSSPNAEDSFLIEKCVGVSCSGFAQIASVGAGITTYADNGLTPGVHRYRVRASNAAGQSAYSSVFEIAIAASPFVTVVVPSPAAAVAAAPSPIMMANTIVVPSPAMAFARMLRPIGLAKSLSDPLVGHGRLGYRDNMRTYRDLIDDKNGRGSSKVEFLPGFELPTTGWSVYDSISGTYQKSVGIVIDEALRDIQGVEIGLSPYSLDRQESLALCVATANSYFYDRTAQILYVRLPGGVSPVTTTTVALVGVFWSTERETHPVLGANKLINPEMDWY